MTWKEFKEMIDKQMAEQCIQEETTIKYIDISYPSATLSMYKPEISYDGKLMAIH